ncbi:hypothetical protein LCGC14_1801670, partial [marine sediment metagenome]
GLKNEDEHQYHERTNKVVEET